jgi:putative ABC transport system permease protein
MSSLKRFWWRLLRSVHSGSEDEDLDREVASHIGLMEDEYRRRGMSAAQAALAVRRDFRGVDAAKERQRDERAFRWIRETYQDFRYAARWLYKRPAFTLTTVTLLALGTGANTAMFSIVDAVLLRATPYQRPHELFRLFQLPQGGTRMPVAPANYLDWRAQSRSFQSMSAFTRGTFTLARGAESERLPGSLASAGLFETLAAQPALGRVFDPEEDQPGGPAVVVLGHAVWSARFGGAPDVVGKPVLLNGQPHTVVGVMPPGFAFPTEQTVLWVPLRLGDTPRSLSRTENYLGVIGRLRENVTRAQSASELETIAQRLGTAYPDSNQRLGIALRSLREYAVGNVQTALLVLMGAVVFVLLIAAVSASNLLLAMSAGRRREISLRASLGATRLRVVRQLLTEATVLALLGGAAGWLLAQGSFSVLLQIIPESVPGISRMKLDGTVLLFSIAVSCALGLIFGLAPALHMTRGQMLEGLHPGRRASYGREVSRVRSVLLAVQIAVALVLLVGAGLMLRTMFKLSAVDLGFDPERVLTVSVAVSPTSSVDPSPQSEAPSALAFHWLLDRVRALPGVRAAGATSAVPTSSDYTSTRLVVEGHPIPEDGRVPEVDYSVVTPGYFDTMEVPLLKGRLLTLADRRSSPPVAVINDTMAARFFADRDPIGRRVRRGGANSTQPWITIVGVVADVRHLGVDQQPVPELFLPHAQVPWPGLTMMVRTDSDPLLLTSTFRDLGRELRPQYELRTTRTMEEFVAASVGTRRLAAQLLALFGVMATIVAAAGIYTVVTFGVVQRTQEFGVRIALGATMADLAAMVLRQSAIPMVIGIVLGVGAASALASLVGTLLYEVNPHDAITFGAASVFLLGVGLISSLPPVRRVFRIDPTTALRAE